VGKVSRVTDSPNVVSSNRPAGRGDLRPPDAVPRSRQLSLRHALPGGGEEPEPRRRPSRRGAFPLEGTRVPSPVHMWAIRPRSGIGRA